MDRLKWQLEYLLRALAWSAAALAFLFGLVIENEVAGLIFLVIASAYPVLRHVFYVVGTLLWKAQQKTHDLPGPVQELPLVSVIIPCFNEESCLTHSLKTIERLSYPNIEIVVADDGSADKSLEIARAFALTSARPVTVLSHLNSGKAHTLNRGIQAANGEFVLCVDGDSFLPTESVTNGMRHLLNNPEVVAVAGSVHVANQFFLITRYQSLEYRLGDLQKTALACSGCVNIVPGPIGLFRKSELIACGMYETDKAIFAEDTDLTLRLIARGGSVVFEPGMISFTEAPESWSALIRQRYRWTRGIYQALRNNIAGLKPPFSIYLFLEKIWLPSADFALLMFFLGQFIGFARIHFFLSYNLIILALEIGSLLAAGWYSRERTSGLLPVLLLSRFTFSIVISTWKFLCLQEEWQNIAMTWDKLDRKGFRAAEESA